MQNGKAEGKKTGKKSGPKIHPLPGRLFLCIALFCLANVGIAARLIPTYKEVLKRLPVLWAARYPVKVHSFVPNPEGLGVLAALHKGHRVYYYHFRVLVYRPLRKEDGKLGRDKIARRVELWVRYRPWKKKMERWDLSFARRDLLPGKHKRWLK